MATPFIPLRHPLSETDVERLNVFLLELSRLEGTIRQPIQSRRSDATVARRSTVQVDVSRITPSISEVVSGVSTVVGTPALTLSTVNTVGSTTTAISVNSTIAAFGTQAPSGDATSAAVGSSAYAARADHVHEFPPTLQSTANNATLTLTDDATDTTLSHSLGRLNIVLPASTAAGTAIVIDPDSTTAADLVLSVQGQPTAGTRQLIKPNWASPLSSDVFSSQTFRCWDVAFSGFAGQHTSSTIAGYDGSAMTLSPSSGSSGGNKAYGIRTPAIQIGNVNATWSEVIGAYCQGPLRTFGVNAAVTIAAGIVTEPSAVGNTQYGIYIRQRTAGQVAANRIGLQIDAQNSGTARWSIFGVSDRAQFTGPLVVDGAFGNTGWATFGASVTLNAQLGVTGRATFGNTVSIAGNLGIFGATPSTQYGTTGTVNGFAAGTSTAVTVDSTYTGNTGSLAYTIGDVIFALKRLGALAY